MNKAKIIEEYNALLESLGVAPEDCVLSAGGACVMLGLRERTNDLDVDVPGQLFRQLLTNGKYEITKFGEVEVLRLNDRVDFHIEEKPGPTIIVDGVCCYSVSRLLDQKLRLNRPKDQRDIEALTKLYTNTIL